MYLKFLSLFLLIEFGMAQHCPVNQNVLEYFEDLLPALKDDLSVLTWHHAVNTEELLVEALKSSRHMIECDLVHRFMDGKAVAVMGHDPENSGSYNLTFQDFLALFNKKPSTVLKGLKLDFKTTDAFQAVMDLDIVNHQQFPLWINGDILRGPGGIPPRIDMHYAKNHKQLDCHTLSIGWTTGVVGENRRYSKEQIDEMGKKRFGKFPRTYPVRAVYVADSWADFNEVLLKNNKDTLTVWSPESDKSMINADKLRKIMIKHKDRIFVDVPEDIKEMIYG